MAKITKQDVFRVASEIDAGGDKPTVLEVRKRLGAGSYTTITAALREWVKPEGDGDGEIDPMPDSVAQKIEQFGDDLYALILRVAHEQFDEERKAWGETKAGLEAALLEAGKLSDMSESALEEERLYVFELRNEVAKHQASALMSEQRLGEELMVCERAKLAAAVAVEEAAKLRGRVEALEKIVETYNLGKSAQKVVKPKTVKQKQVPENGTIEM